MRVALLALLLVLASASAGCAWPKPEGGAASDPCPEGSVPWNASKTPDEYGHEVDPGHPGGMDPNGNGQATPTCVR